MNQIKFEYLSLVNLLNKANKTKNEMTQLTFFVDDTDKKHLKLFAALSKNQKILLCEKRGHNKWIPTGVTKFSELEKFIAKNSSNYYSLNFADLILARIFELPD